MDHEANHFERSRQRRIVEGAGVTDLEALELVRALDRRFAMRYTIVLILVIAVFIGTFGGALLLGRLALDESVVLPVAGMGSVAAAALVGWCGIQRHQWRQIEHCLHSPVCFGCGYLLRGLSAVDAHGVVHVQCPECGRRSPIARGTGR